MKPDDPDPHKVKDLWKAHIAKAIQEAYKDFKQAFRKTKGKDFSKYLEESFGKERMEIIYEGLKSQQLKFEDFIK